MSSCPSEIRLTQALSEGMDGPLAAHVHGCGSCQQVISDLRPIVELAPALPYVAPSEHDRVAARERLLHAARSVPLKPKPWTVMSPWLAAAAVLLIIVGAALRPKPSTTVALHGRVDPLGPARFAHQGPPADEIVRLADGSILVEVSPLSPGERFRVVTGADEIEVRGTLFEATAASERLQAVRVLRGVVEVHPRGGAMQRLAVGERWHATAVTQADPPSPAVAPALKPIAVVRPSVPTTPAAPARPIARVAVVPDAGHADDSPAPASPAPTPEERSFAEGMDALRAGQYSAAAAAFERTVQVAGNQSMAEDARYFRAIALARAGRAEPAIAAMEEFLKRHAASARAGEISSILGWQLLDRGAIDAAEARFRAALADRRAEVRKSAEKGIQAIQSLQTPR